MRAGFRFAIGAVLLAGLVGCMPQDRRPGLWLRGEVSSYPTDWSFTDEHREIALEVRAPYLLPHSVTIWCVSLDQRLYIGARAPDTKRWPGWVESDPDVRLGIDGSIYEARLSVLDDPDKIARLQAAYGVKYELPDPPPEELRPVRYWRVEPRG